MLIYAGIGSRQTPDPTLESMTTIAYQLAPHWCLRSGHADGADQAFEEGALKWALESKRQPNMEIFLPWTGFNGATTSSIYITPEPTAELIRVAALFHPAWDRCSPAAKFMHMRNVCQIAGKNLDTPATMVVCWTSRGRREGGTGQALRIADYLKIPIFDLAIPGVDRKFCSFVKDQERKMNRSITNDFHGKSNANSGSDRHHQQSNLRRVS